MHFCTNCVGVIGTNTYTAVLYIIPSELKVDENFNGRK